MRKSVTSKSSSLISLKAIGGGRLERFSPKIGALQILETTKTTLLLQARLNLTNPTDYSASVPFVDINLLSNGTIVGNATARNITVVPGENTNLVVEALWDPLTSSGNAGLAQGRELLSQYISGMFKPTMSDKQVYTYLLSQASTLP